MPQIPGLRSPYDRVGRLVFFGRMLDKIRLHAAGQLPPAYQSNLGDGKPGFFDARCCRFLGLAYADLVARTLQGGSDEEILEWAHARGTSRSDDDCMVWSRFMMKVGWRDERAPLVQKRIVECGLAGKPVETMFDVLDYDEDRDPGATRPWDAI